MKNKLTLIMALTALFTMILGCSETPKTPEWTKAEVIAENLDHPSAIASDDKNIYYATGGTIASLNEGTSGVWKIPIGGGQPVQLFKGYKKDEKNVFIPDAFVLAVDEKYVYFSAGYVFRVSKDGGEPQQITAGTPTEMVLDNENIYWHNYVGEGMTATPVYSVSKNGGEAKTLTEDANISDIAIDNEFLYWSEPNGIYKVSKKGGEKSKVYSVETGQVRGFVLDNDFIYAQYWQNPNTQIVKISKIGLQHSNLGKPENIQTSFPLKIDENYVYLIKNTENSNYVLCRISKLSGEIVEIDAGYLTNYSVTKGRIYFTDINKLRVE